MAITDIVQVVDDKDSPIGSASIQVVWDKNLIHRISRVMLENSKGQILLQKRAVIKPTYPNCWDNSAAGHVDANESYFDAAKRELAEELGIVDLDLIEIGYYYSESSDGKRHFRRFNKAYKAFTDITPNNLQKEEVSGVRWFNIEEVKKIISEQPDEVTGGLKQVIERFYL
jgi:isopentenyl-diphosphate delta-isomerase type 1